MCGYIRNFTPDRPFMSPNETQKSTVLVNS
jgi:hypothetical protein